MDRANATVNLPMSRAGLPAAEIGILMLDTGFARPPGDVGNPETWPFAVRFATVTGARAGAALADPEALLSPFVAEGQRLVAEGCRGLATSCGFLAPLQRPLAAALGVPVMASALTMAPSLAATLPTGRRLGVLTIDAAALTPAIRRAAGLPEDTAIRGLPSGGALSGPILEGRCPLDPDAARAEVVAETLALASEPGVGAVLFECTNLPPYAAAAAAASGLPVHSMVSALAWFAAGLSPPRW